MKYKFNEPDITDVELLHAKPYLSHLRYLENSGPIKTSTFDSDFEPIGIEIRKKLCENELVFVDDLIEKPLIFISWKGRLILNKSTCGN